MQGDLNDMVARLRTMLPKRWFGEDTPNLTSLLRGLSSSAVWLFSLIQYSAAQTRTNTASGRWLDLLAFDYFGSSLSRRPGETDVVFRGRIKDSLFRDAATRPALLSALTRLTGKAPSIFEPSRPADTGAYGTLINGPNAAVPSLAYGCTGGWGTLDLPNQVFVTISRPPTPLVANISGYGCPNAGYGAGPLSYIELDALIGNVSDSEIQELVAQLLPINATAWIRLT
jgi:hypothetical protein